MSAYFVDKIVIDVLVSYAVKHGLYARLTKGARPVRVEHHNANHFGKMLWHTNELSILTRYPHAPDDERKLMADAVAAYEFTGYVVTPARALGCSRNLAYQACEIAKWEASRCQLFCLKVESDAGYRMATERGVILPFGMSDHEASTLQRMHPTIC